MTVLAGTVDIAAAYLGATALDKIYVGTEQVWPVAGGGGDLITANRFGHYDAEDAASFTYDTGAVVMAWADLGGGGHHMVSLAPSISPERNGTINGHTAVTFGSSDWLLVTGYTPPAQPYTVYLVLAAGLETTLRPFIGDGAVYIGRHGGVAPDNILFTGGHPNNHSVNGYDAGPHLIAGVFNGASSLQRIDGVTVGTSTMGTGTLSGLRLSNSGGGMVFTLGEAIFYGAAHTLTEVEQNEAYLADKWGL